MHPRKIAIIGGGIAGIAFAQRYRQLGGRVSIHERGMPQHDPGMGFILLANGFEALSHIGRRSAVKDLSYPLTDCTIRDHRDQKLVDEKLDSAHGITRSAFLEALGQDLPEGWTRYGQAFSHFEYHPSGQAHRAIFQNGEGVEADLFLGCDGTNSKVRGEIFPASKVSRSRVVELVSVIENDLLVARCRKRFMKFRHKDGGLALGLVPATRRKLIWYLQFDRQKYPTPEADPARLESFSRRLTQGWSGPALQLIEATDFGRTRICHTGALSPLQQYFSENVALLGDAAHAVHSFTSQGVNTAIEDAVYLAEALTNGHATGSLDPLAIYSETRRNAMRTLFDFGNMLQDEFLAPPTADQRIPLATTA
ncbi:MAG: NAD(P)/FAD-dependent oxidoreductase [Myxococcota bacterium]|nr:NAD(P)/FAD-dependent oxidoreductase [Myxococcota bacterium]